MNQVVAGHTTVLADVGGLVGLIEKYTNQLVAVGGVIIIAMLVWVGIVLAAKSGGKQDHGPGGGGPGREAIGRVGLLIIAGLIIGGALVIGPVLVSLGQ